ncbi:MAG TPA: VWA domain-containing protein [Thermohalobaculum sp.]|nr:VWA domain-containing protein [Thermohalobaculum sp.]
MTDELDRLREALEATRPEPDPKVRGRAMDAALRAFDEENAEARQGSAATDRHSKRGAGWLARLFGGRPMQISIPSLKPALMGGASLAVIALAVVVSRDVQKELDLAPPVASPPVSDMRVERDLNRGSAAGGYGQQGSASTAMEPNAVTGADTKSLRSEVLAKDKSAEFATAPVGSRQNLEQEHTSTVDAITGGAAGIVGNAAPLAAGNEVRMRREAPAMQSLADAPAEQFRAAGQIKADIQGQPTYQDQGRDRFAEIEANPVKVTAEEPVSTFSIDVDTASYSFMRRSLMQGVLPQKDAVRVEEMINYFPYDYPLPEGRETPFRADVQVMPTPWNAGTQLMRIGIQGYALADSEKPRSNLVFLIDSSGSMNAPDKLPLLVNSFRLLLDSLDPDDTVSIVVYAGAAGTVLEPTKVSESGKILAALDNLHAGGSTAGAEGIRQAYRLAESGFDPAGVNRVILATDGDFNVGITDLDELKGFVERKRETGVFLSVLGFGQGNLNDELMQALAQNGNGQAAYIDTLSEARKALVEEAGSTLFPIAKDVKIQIEFNPAAVAEYRLIGYETRMLRREDFNNDKVDAGEIGSGHRVTALYEITPAGSAARVVDDLRYQAAAPHEANPSEYAFLKIRYKAPDGDTSTLITTPVTRAMAVEPDEDRARETRFAAAVAGFGQLLRGGRHMGDYSYDDVVALAQGAKGDDPFGYRAEFVNLVRLAKSAAALEPLK